MKNIAFHSLSVLTKTCLVMLIIAMLMVGGVFFSLARGPINLGFAKEYVQNALNDQTDEVRVSLKSLQLEWSSYKNALLLTLGDVRLLSLIHI